MTKPKGTPSTRLLTSSDALGKYTDCFSIFDAALKHNGLIITLESPGKAMSLKARLNKARSLLRKINAEMTKNIVGLAPASKYDGIVVYQERGTSVLNLEYRKPKGIFETPDGKLIDIADHSNPDTSLDGGSASAADLHIILPEE